jgi:hypothetical protein
LAVFHIILWISFGLPGLSLIDKSQYHESHSPQSITALTSMLKAAGEPGGKTVMEI